MSKLSLVQIEHLAALARIRLSDQEKDRLGRELGKIVQFYATIQAATVNGNLSAERQTLALPNGDLRPDELNSGPVGLTKAELKELAPQYSDGQVVVPPVFELS